MSEDGSGDSTDGLGELDDLPEDDPFEQFGEELFDDESVAADWERFLAVPERVEEPVENEAIVPKRSFCERCEHFSAPPAVSCRHPGTTIVELTDVEHFRVTDCPVVERRRRIGEYTE